MLLDQVRLHSSRQGCDWGVTVSSQPCSPSFSTSCFHHSPPGVAAPLDPSPAAGGYHKGSQGVPRLLSHITGVCAWQGENPAGSKISCWHIWYLTSAISVWRANWFYLNPGFTRSFQGGRGCTPKAQSQEFWGVLFKNHTGLLRAQSRSESCFLIIP